MATANYRIAVDGLAHELRCTLELSRDVAGPLELSTPTWVPGAYSPMKYGRDVFDIQVRDGDRELTWERKGWQGISVADAPPKVTVSWRAVAYDPAWGELSGIVDHEYAVLRATRLLFDRAHSGPCSVAYEVPSGWAIHHPAGAKNIGTLGWEYPSFAALLDSCVVCGKFERITRKLDGVEFHHVFLDRAVGFDTEANGFIDALMKVAAEAKAIFGSFPFADYTYIFSHSPSAHWGLEHPDCTMIAIGENVYVDAAARNAGIRVCGHELFHAWNVCRLKPLELQRANPVDPPTPDSLWVAEGVTRYFEFVLGARVGEISAEQVISNIANYQRYLLAQPAYAHVSPRDSSRATFLNHTRYPGSINAMVDYYDQGMLIAFALDQRLRAAGSSLDAQFGKFYAAHVASGYSHEQIVHELATDDAMRAQLRREIEKPGALDAYAQLEAMGFKREMKQVPTLGIVLAKDNAGPEVMNVLDGGAAQKSGLAPTDVIQRVDGFPYSLKSLKWLIEHRQRLTLGVLRGHRTLEFTIDIGKREDLASLTWQGTEAQLQRVRDWLKQPALAWKSGQAIPLSAYDNFHGVQTVI